MKWRNIFVQSAAAACLLAGFLSNAWGQGIEGRGSFGGELSGLTTLTAEVVCVGCSLKEVRKAQPNLFNLYQFSDGQEPFVMQINSFYDPSQRHYWQSVVGLGDKVTVRAADHILEELTAEENLFKPMTITGVLRSTGTFDIGRVRVRE